MAGCCARPRRQTADDRLGALWAVLVATGIRESEALALQWSDVDLDEGLIEVHNTLHRIDGEWLLMETKTEKSERSIRVGPTTVAALKRHRLRQMEERLAAGIPGVDGLVFTTTRGMPINGSNLVAVLHKVTARLGIPTITVHGLRHMFVTHQLANGVPLAEVAAAAGHSSSRVTEAIYSHMSGKDLTAGAEVMERMVR